MLNSVSEAALAPSGIRLQPPTSAAVVSQQAAEEAALRSMPGRAVREAALADFTATHTVPPVSALAWAVALTVPAQARGGPSPGVPVKPLFMVVFIDARTGAFIMATGAGRLQPDGS